MSDTMRTAAHWLAAALTVAGLLLLAKAWLDYAITEIAITDRRVIYKRGLIRRLTAEMNIDKVESVVVNQSVLARLLQFGEIDLRGTGGGIEGIADLADPLRFRSAITAR